MGRRVGVAPLVVMELRVAAGVRMGGDSTEALVTSVPA